MRFERLNAVVAKNFGLRVQAQHERDVGPVNVGVEQSHFVSQLGQDDGEIDCESGLPYTAFAGTYGDDCAYTGQGLRGWWLLWLSGAWGKRSAHH